MDKNDMVTHYVWDCMVLWCCKTKPYTANSKRKMKKCHRCSLHCYCKHYFAQSHLELRLVGYKAHQQNGDDLDVLTSLLLRQYIKASVRYFPVMTSLSVNKWMYSVMQLNDDCLAIGDELLEDSRVPARDRNHDLRDAVFSKLSGERI